VKSTLNIVVLALFLGLFLSVASAQQVQSMKLLTAQIGWAQRGPHLYWTTDDGAHWKDIGPAKSSQTSIASVFFLDTSTGWALLAHEDDNGVMQFDVAATTDSGADWVINRIRAPNRRPTDLMDRGWINFAGPLRGWVLLRGNSARFKWGVMLSTEDGGRSWGPARPTTDWGSLRFF
jgi:hypothetical protein